MNETSPKSESRRKFLASLGGGVVLFGFLSYVFGRDFFKEDSQQALIEESRLPDILEENLTKEQIDAWINGLPENEKKELARCFEEYKNSCSQNFDKITEENNQIKTGNQLAETIPIKRLNEEDRKYRFYGLFATYCKDFKYKNEKANATNEELKAGYDFSSGTFFYDSKTKGFPYLIAELTHAVQKSMNPNDPFAIKEMLDKVESDKQRALELYEDNEDFFNEMFPGDKRNPTTEEDKKLKLPYYLIDSLECQAHLGIEKALHYYLNGMFYKHMSGALGGSEVENTFRDLYKKVSDIHSKFLESNFTDNPLYKGFVWSNSLSPHSIKYFFAGLKPEDAIKSIETFMELECFENTSEEKSAKEVEKEIVKLLAKCIRKDMAGFRNIQAVNDNAKLALVMFREKGDSSVLDVDKQQVKDSYVYRTILFAYLKKGILDFEQKESFINAFGLARYSNDL